MACRRISVDPDMGRLVREMMQSKHGNKGRNSPNHTRSPVFLPRKLVRNEEKEKAEEENEVHVDICTWKGKPVHEGLCHSDIRERYWSQIHGRTYLRCVPEVYRYTACMFARSIPPERYAYVKRQRDQQKSLGELDTIRRRIIRKYHNGKSKKALMFTGRTSLRSGRDEVTDWVIAEK